MILKNKMTVPSTIDEMTTYDDDLKPPQDREFEIPKDFVPPPPNREVGELSIFIVYIANCLSKSITINSQPHILFSIANHMLLLF